MSALIYSEIDHVATTEVLSPRCVEHVITSDILESRLVQDEIERALSAFGFGDRDIFCIQLSLAEALTNAIKHGNRLDRAKHVQISYRVDLDRFEITISDEGAGFDPSEVPDPTTPENLERPCGRGIMLMRHYMTTVHFNSSGDSVRMSRVRSHV